MTSTMLLRGGRVVDPVTGSDEFRDIGIAEGILVPPEDLHAAEVVDLSGRVVAPGFIDLHVHLRDPGQLAKEDVHTGTRAAAAGGFSTVVAMPNTVPPADSAAVVAEILSRCRRHAVVRVLQTGCLSIGRLGRDLADAAVLKGAGAVALTDDGTGIQEAGLMLQALERARAVRLPVLDHCEDMGVVAGGVLHAGRAARELGLPGNRAVSEELIVARNAILSRETDWPVHIQHVSAARTVALLRAAQAQGAAVTAEATPHHICLTEEACLEHGTNAKMNPPLRTEADRQAIMEGLKDGTISTIATDHAPHTAEEKARDFIAAPAGIVGLEAAVPLCLTALYHPGLLSLSEFVAKFTAGPRSVLGVPYGTLALGAPADVTILDLDACFTVDVNAFLSRSRNCPYHGWRCRGKAVGTIVAGRWAWRDPVLLPG